jgi:transposase
MANQLKMAMVQALLALHAKGWSQRRIARELGIHRETVARHIRLAGSKPAIPLTGSEAVFEAKPAIPLTGSAGRFSQCEPFREVIQAKLDQDLSAQRIYQDLVSEHSFIGSYSSVQRFVRRLTPERTLPFRRMECGPGVEAQVDFGSGAPLLLADGRRRRPHVFRIVLSHSRKGYSEVVERQTTEVFLRCVENAFWHFGGVPQTLVIDNLKAAVTQADWFDPELNPKMQAFAAHYGVAILPTKPRTPRHKGKIEHGVGYVKKNALKGRIFASLAEQNLHLRDWEQTVADTRIHGTTRRQVAKVFAEVERSALQPLPSERFPSFHEAQRLVHRDGHVEVDKAYYSVPPEYLGHPVWVRWDARMVRIFNQRMEAIAVHARHSSGRFSTQRQHLVAEKISGVERGATWLLAKASRIGPHTARWAAAMLQHRGIEGVRVLLGLVSLTKRYPAATLETACAAATRHDAYRLRTIRQLLKRQPAPQSEFVFTETHPLIRSLADYGQVVRASLGGDRLGGREPAAPVSRPPNPPPSFPLSVPQRNSAALTSLTTTEVSF